ncbi:MAG: cobalamin biosynthesis protein CobW [Cyanobacteria bacterium P01_A01_bin.84]
MHKIPVTVITGFLGAGKTTLIRHLLQNNQGRRIAVLVNEFGEVGIDGELLRSCQVCDPQTETLSNIVELTNGCLCCTVQEEFYPVMQELIQRKDEIDCILVETSGLALPKPLVQAFRWHEIRNGATVDGVVTVVDAQAIAAKEILENTLVNPLESYRTTVEAQRQADQSIEHETPIEELFEEQLAFADLVLLTKTDLLDELTLTKVQKWLYNQVPTGVKLISAKNGEIIPELLLGFNAAVEDNLNTRHTHHAHEEEHEHDDEINSVQFILDEAFEPKALINRLQGLVKQQEIYRIKGFVHVPNKPMRMILQGVGNRFDSFYDRLWLEDEERQTRLVFIGRELQAAQVEKAILN